MTRLPAADVLLADYKKPGGLHVFAPVTMVTS